MSTMAKILVVDTGAFVNKVPLWEHGEELVSVDEVLNEIKDPQTQQFVAAFPVAIEYKQPQPASLKFITEFTKKTGDYHALSLTDIKLLALTYELEVAANGKDHLRTEPIKVITNTHISVPVAQLEQQNEIKQSKDSNMETDGNDTKDKDAADNDDDEGWCVVRKRKRPATAGADSVMNTSVADDTVSVASTVTRKREALARNMLPGFYLAPDDEDDRKVQARSTINWQLSFIGPSILETLEDHLTIYSYISGYQPCAQYELLALRIVDCLLPVSPSTEELQDKQQQLSTSKLAEQCDLTSLLSLLEKLAEQGSLYNHKAELSSYPSLQRWLQHVRSRPWLEEGLETLQQSSLAQSLMRTVEENLETVALGDDEDGDSDDGGGWITPNNIGQLMQGDETPDAGDVCFFDECEAPQAPAVACITTDFAMQNVLRHIGLSVKGSDGKLIKNVRNYVLRCFACFKVTHDMSKLFCPKCGNRTLKRVSMTMNADGTQQIWISRRPLNTRGFKFNLPKPRGGQHAVMPLLTADQRFPQQWAKRSKNTNALNPDFVAGSCPFSTRDVYSRAAQHGYVSGNNAGIKGQLKHAKIWKPKNGKRLKK